MARSFALRNVRRWRAFKRKGEPSILLELPASPANGICVQSFAFKFALKKHAYNGVHSSLYIKAFRQESPCYCSQKH